jgi:hypothetical protein
MPPIRPVAPVALSVCLAFACGADDGGASNTTTATSVTTAPTSVTDATATGTPTTGAPTSGASEGSGTGTSSTGGLKLDVGVGDTDTDTGSDQSACQQAEAALSNQGCRFWAVDLPNAWKVQAFPAPELQTFAIVAANTSGFAATVSVYAGTDAAPIKTGKVPSDATYVFALDNALGTKNRESSFGTAYRVESDLPITLYQFNPLDNSTEVFSNDASLLFPVHVLDRDYTAVTGDGTRLGALNDHYNAGAFVTVVATEDDTHVDLFLPKGVPIYPSATKLTLTRGQTYTLMSNGVANLFQNVAGQGNLSGTRVAADRPVAVFSGNVASFEPTPQNGCCADHLEHQMLPLSAWGSSYVVTAAAPNSGSAEDKVRVRIVGSFDGTKLSYSPAPPPGAPATIDAYQTVAFTADSSFVVSADQPFSVFEFLLSNAVVTVDPTPDDDADNGTWPGDPAMILVPPSAQYQSKYVFLVPKEYAANFVTIVRPAGAGVTLDGADVTADAAWDPVGMHDDTSWERGHFAVAGGPHTVEAADEAKIGIIVVGYDTAVSFGYAGGSGVEFIAAPPVPPQL